MNSCVFQCDIPINGQNSDSCALCVYTVAGWDVMSCVFGITGMAFLYGSILVKVPMLQVGTVVI